MKAQPVFDRMDQRVFARLGERVRIDHVAGGVTNAYMVIDHDIEGMQVGFDGVKQSFVPDVVGSLLPADAVNAAVGDSVNELDDDDAPIKAYKIGVVYPVRDNIHTFGLTGVAL